MNTIGRTATTTPVIAARVAPTSARFGARRRTCRTRRTRRTCRTCRTCRTRRTCRTCRTRRPSGDLERPRQLADVLVRPSRRSRARCSARAAARRRARPPAPAASSDRCAPASRPRSSAAPGRRPCRRPRTPPSYRRALPACSCTARYRSRAARRDTCSTTGARRSLPRPSRTELRIRSPSASSWFDMPNAGTSRSTLPLLPAMSTAASRTRYVPGSTRDRQLVADRQIGVRRIDLPLLPAQHGLARLVEDRKTDGEVEPLFHRLGIDLRRQNQLHLVRRGIAEHVGRQPHRQLGVRRRRSQHASHHDVARPGIRP